MRFSIIIPVYNVEKYIRRCMDTVMNQTFDDFEVIVVDDETPDNSMAIVQEFVDAYPGKIHVIHQKNTRQGGARNRGVREAKGEYILFVDSDDYVDVHMLEKVDAHLKAKPCDILAFKYQMVTESGKKLGVGGFGGLQPGIYYPEKDKNILMLPAGPVHKAYRRSFYVDSHVQFPEKVLYEDAVVRELFARASSVELMDECLYYYVQSGNSSIRQKPSEKMLDILTVTDIICERFQNAELYEIFQQPLEMSLIVSIVFIIDLINADDPRSPLQIPLADYIADNFKGYSQNPYINAEMRKGLECLIAHDFRRYHNRFLRWKMFKEWLLGNPLISKLNELRKRA